MCRNFSGLLLTLLLIPMAVADTPSMHGRHVFFDNSAAMKSYFYGDATVAAPSKLEIVEGKTPVDAEHFRSPPNSLRLKWTAAPGGDWHVTFKAPTRYIRNQRFDGDTLSLWCFSEKELKPEDGPRIFLQDDAGAGVPTIPLLADREPLTAGKWTELRLPFSKFSGQYQGTGDFQIRFPSFVEDYIRAESRRRTRAHSLY
jgi:hypothetical protein